MSVPIWLDCDPGHDDALALALCAYSPEVDFLGVSTVAGNQTVAKTTRNALNFLTLIGADHVPVHPGAAKPLVRPSRICSEIHGSTGLDGIDWNPVEQLRHARGREASPVAAVPAMVAAVRAYRATHPDAAVNIVATGCLTNVAALLTLHPELARAGAIRVTIMGGASGVRGNTKALAEYNIEIDPEAAAVVFNAAKPVSHGGYGLYLAMVPLDVTHTALATPAVTGAIRAACEAAANPQGPAATQQFADRLLALMTFFTDTYRDVFRFASPPVHDPCAVFHVLNPAAFQTRFLGVEIETAGTFTAGATCVDFYGFCGYVPNVHVAEAMDVPRFWDKMTAALAAAAAKTPSA
jgi:inosine-uridine nucleoside N-ribohydrolase